MRKKPTRREFLQWSAATALVGGVSLLVLMPREKKCIGAWDCTTCSLDPKKDQGCPKYGEEVVDEKIAPTPTLPLRTGGGANSRAGEGHVKEDSHA